MRALLLGVCGYDHLPPFADSSDCLGHADARRGVGDGEIDFVSFPRFSRGARPAFEHGALPAGERRTGSGGVLVKRSVNELSLVIGETRCGRGF